MTWLFWIPLLVVLWVHVVMLGLLWVAPRRLRAAEERWPRLVHALERGQQVIVGVMLLGLAISVTVLALRGGLAERLPPAP
jgi:hypothetical protein